MLFRSGTACAVTGLSTVNGKVVSAVYILDFSKEEPEQVVNIEGDVIIASKFMNRRIFSKDSERKKRLLLRAGFITKFK